MTKVSLLELKWYKKHEKWIFYNDKNCGEKIGQPKVKQLLTKQTKISNISFLVEHLLECLQDFN